MKYKRDAHWYKEVLDAMSELVLVKGDRSKLLWANKAFLDYYGMTAEQLEDIIDSPHSDPDDTVQYVKDDHLVFTTGRTLDIPSEPVTDSHGDIAYFHTIKSAVKDDSGAVVRTVGVSRIIKDAAVLAVSERNRANRKEQLSELRTMVRYMPQAVAMFDVKQRFLSYSLAWCELFGYPGNDLIGHFFDEHFEGHLALSSSMATAVDSGQAVTLQSAPLQTAQDRDYVVDVQIRPWLVPSGETGGVIVLVQDITRMQEAQEELRRLNDELMQFNYRVSHDLLSPLKTVLGYADLCDAELEDGNLDEVREYHSVIRESVGRLSALVEDVLNLARADVLSDEKYAFTFAELLDEILAKYRLDIETAGIKVSLDIDLPTFYTQRVRVLQVMENLIANAVKYHDRNKAERLIFVTARVENSDDADLIVTVRDNGIGFDDKLSTQIFAIFKRGNSKYPGSGLGLYIVKKHLDHLRGTIAVLSSRDDTIFEVRLPASTLEVPP